MDKEKQADYHSKIMNIQIAVGEQVSAINQALERNRLSDKIIYAYKLGHRDARHHAAEIANDADAEIARLKAEIERKDRAVGRIKHYLHKDVHEAERWVYLYFIKPEEDGE